MIALLLLIISFGLVFAGAVAAAPQVNVTLVDGSGAVVNKTSPGEVLNITANASTDQYLNDPALLITVNPKSGLKLNDTEAVMFYDGQTIKNDPLDPFFYWSDTYNAWIWWIGYVYGDQFPGELAQLFLPATVNDTGEITVNADYMQWDEELNEPILLATSSFTFQSVEAAAAGTGTVPMQDTGVPVGLAALAMLSIVGGSVYGKLR